GRRRQRGRRLPGRCPRGEGRCWEDALVLGGPNLRRGAATSWVAGGSGGPGLRPVPLRQLREELPEANEAAVQEERAGRPTAEQRCGRAVANPLQRLLPRPRQRVEG